MSEWSNPNFMFNWQLDMGPKTKKSLGGAALSNWTVQKILNLASEDVKKEWHNLPMQYSGIGGGHKLRSLISSQYKHIDADNVVVFSGAQEALSCIYLSLLDSDSNVLGLTPSYSPMNLACEKTGANLQEHALSFTDNKWSLDFDQLNQKINNKTDLLVVNFPHNPTGYLPNQSDLQLLVEQAESKGTRVLCDEVFKGLEYNKKDALPPACDLSERGISVGSLSKAYGCPSLRIGWVATQDKELIKKLLMVKRYFSICSSSLDEFLAAIMVENKEIVFNENVQFLKKRYDHFERLVGSELSEVLSFSKSKAGLVLFPQFKNNKEAEKVCTDFLNDSGFRLEPGLCFGKEFGSHFRIGLGVADFSEGIERLNKYLNTKT